MTAAKTEITIVIPSIKRLEESAIIQSYVASETKQRLAVQFVYLQNLKTGGSHAPAIQDFADYQLVTVTNTRFFDTVEENMFRLQDMLGMLKPLIFIVGEHDGIDWAALEQSLAFRAQHGLDVMGWNLLCKEMREDGSYVANLALVEVNDPGMANHFCKQLLGGQPLEGAVGYPAMLSVYGPLDWIAFIGNHLYTRAALSRMLQYTFPEYIYSHVYKQALFFTEQKVRYGIFAGAVIHRVSNDFLKQRRGEQSWVSPRQAQGASPIFWMGNLANLYVIEDEPLFTMLIHCLRVALTGTETGEQVHSRMSLFQNLILWGLDTIRFAVEGRSFYFPEQTTNGSLQDLRYAKLYFTRVLRQMERDAMYRILSPEVPGLLRDVVVALDAYLGALDGNLAVLVVAYEKLAAIQPLMRTEIILQLNAAAFSAYLQHKGKL